jgi:hypothetical protein
MTIIPDVREERRKKGKKRTFLSYECLPFLNIHLIETIVSISCAPESEITFIPFLGGKNFFYQSTRCTTQSHPRSLLRGIASLNLR